MSMTVDKTPGQMPIQMSDPKIPALGKAHNKVELQKAAKDFEGLFMDIVMKSMRDTVGESDAFGDTKNTKFFQSMLDTEYSKAIGKDGKIGLADAIVRQLGPKVEARTETKQLTETK